MPMLSSYFRPAKCSFGYWQEKLIKGTAGGVYRDGLARSGDVSTPSASFELMVGLGGERKMSGVGDDGCALISIIYFCSPYPALIIIQPIDLSIIFFGPRYASELMPYAIKTRGHPYAIPIPSLPSLLFHFYNKAESPAES
jgi:hypothetical protein